MSYSNGRILCEAAYAQGKMLDHSGFGLPRGISPSDIDMTIDNNGQTLVVELSSQQSDWNNIAIGQRKTYEQLVHYGRGSVVALLAKHSTPREQSIKTASNAIRSVHVMWWHTGSVLIAPDPMQATLKQFVDSWFAGRNSFFTNRLRVA